MSSLVNLVNYLVDAICDDWGHVNKDLPMTTSHKPDDRMNSHANDASFRFEAAFQPDSLRFERRRADRHAVVGRVTSLQYFGKPGPQQHRKIASLQLVNISDTGVCVLAQEPVEVNAAMTIFFPPHGVERGFDAIGHVVRCTRRDDHHHELGIRFDYLPAA